MQAIVSKKCYLSNILEIILCILVSILDIERSKQVHDDSIEYIKDLNELIKMNLFGTDLSDEGLVSNLLFETIPSSENSFPKSENIGE